MNANAGKWDFTGQKISDVKPIAAKLALHQFPDYLRNLRIARVHAIHIREMLRQTPGTMECPVGAATLRIAEHDSLQLNEVFLLKILGKIGSSIVSLFRATSFMSRARFITLAYWVVRKM